MMLIALSSKFALAADKYRINCVDDQGFASFISPTKPFHSKILPENLIIPENLPGEANGNEAISNPTHFVRLERFKDTVTISLNNLI